MPLIDDMCSELSRFCSGIYSYFATILGFNRTVGYDRIEPSPTTSVNETLVPTTTPLGAIEEGEPQELTTDPKESHGPKLLSHLKSESPTKPAYPLYEDSNSISFERASGSSDGQYRGDQLGSPGERDAPDSLSKTNFLKFNSNDGDSSNNFSISSIEKSGSQGREIPLENKKISNLMQEFPDSGGIQNAEGKKLTINRARSEKISGLAGKLGNIDITKTMGPSSGMGSLKLRRAATNAPSSYDQTSPVPVEFTVESPESPHSLVDTIKSRPKSFHSNKRPPSRKFLRDTLVKQNDSSLSGDLLFGFEDPSPTTERPLSNFENLDSVSQAPESSVLSAEDFFSVEEVSEYQKKSDELLKGFDSLRD